MPEEVQPCNQKMIALCNSATSIPIPLKAEVSLLCQATSWVESQQDTSLATWNAGVQTAFFLYPTVSASVACLLSLEFSRRQSESLFAHFVLWIPRDLCQAGTPKIFYLLGNKLVCAVPPASQEVRGLWLAFVLSFGIEPKSLNKKVPFHSLYNCVQRVTLLVYK